MADDPLHPAALTPTARDRDLFDELLRDFVPPAPYDFHAHLYRYGQDGLRAASPPHDDATLACYRRQVAAWMGDRAPQEGLFFPMPSREVDAASANQFCLDEASSSPRSRALALVRPSDDPAQLDAWMGAHAERVVGLKPYHVYAERPDTMHATLDEFLPAWAWDLAHQRSLLVMLHIVRPRALADRGNIETLQRRCREFPRARVILAHAGRGFCAWHTVTGIEGLAGLENVFFDTSAICEPAPLLAILQQFGPSRLLFGTDYPVSNFRGRSSSLADGFCWFDEQNVDWSSNASGTPSLVGLESLLAVWQACRLARLDQDAVQQIFQTNAHNLLGLSKT